MSTPSQSASTEPFAPLSAYRDLHRGQTMVVCGCGASLKDLREPHRFVTIGVNDVGRLFDPTYLVVVNPRRQFAADRFQHVEQSRATTLFTQLELGAVRPRVARIRLGRYAGTDLDQMAAHDVLHYTQNSPYIALCLAAYMGASRIGLIGVDFTGHHFFADTGVHSLSSQLQLIDQQYRAMYMALHARCIEVFNLSGPSRLTAFPKISVDAFIETPTGADAPQPRAKKLSVVSYATTPVAGVPAILARCIRAATDWDAHCVWERGDYGNGVRFDSGGTIEWSRDPTRTQTALVDADVVIVHNGKVDARHRRWIEGKPVVTIAHNYMWNVNPEFVNAGYPGLVVGQYQATLAEFAGWRAVPNPLPLWEAAHQPRQRDSRVTIAYTPSGRHERYPQAHPLYWHGKGYDSTMRILDGLARRYPVAIEAVRARQMSHADALKAKQRAHIVIDECVTGSYHRNSLEGLAAGAVVVNGVGLLPPVEGVIRACTRSGEAAPFVFASLESLEETLESLLRSGHAALESQGRDNRRWMEDNWRFDWQWERFWMPAIDRAIERARGRGARAPSAAIKEPAMSVPPIHRVSVVIPHGGAERLPHLRTTLASLRQRPDVFELIVAELGVRPEAMDIAARWADKHVYVEHIGAFERAMALNAGSAVAEGDAVLWHDNDLIMSEPMLARSVAELNQRGLDFLVPYTEIRYLSQTDTDSVMRGERAPDECGASNTYFSGRMPACSGGIGLVRRDFLERHGGFIEGFIGWGGEDNAWNHKVRLLGRSAVTRHSDHVVAHLYHPSSGGLAPGSASANNPHYRYNVQLLERIRVVRNGAEFARRFPAALHPRGILTRSPGRNTGARAAAPMPVWVYWEGPCPAWIRACRRTIARYAPEIRFLEPASFDALRDRDRDIDLARLGAAQRADFIRAFLLHRYGGLWIDADCLVLRPLDYVLARVRDNDYVAHRERSGLVSNGFIGARLGSRIAEDHYARVCRILRAHKPVYWTTLGSEPLNVALSEDSSGWHELACEQIQPVCWSRPDVFFVEAADEEHARSVPDGQLCFMLSNTTVSRHAGGNPGLDLMKPRTFFSYLLRCALGTHGDAQDFEHIFDANMETYRHHRLESMSGPGSGLEQTRHLRRQLPLMLDSLEISSLLDAPCGDFHWMQYVRLGGRRYTGVDVHGEIIAQNRWRHGRDDRVFMRADLTCDPLPRADAIVCRDLLPHMSFDEARRVLRNFVSTGAVYLLTTHFPASRPSVDTSGGAWRPLDLTAAPFGFPPPLAAIVEHCAEAGGAFSDKCLALWRLADIAACLEMTPAASEEGAREEQTN